MCLLVPILWPGPVDRGQLSPAPFPAPKTKPLCKASRNKEGCYPGPHLCLPYYPLSLLHAKDGRSANKSHKEQIRKLAKTIFVTFADWTQWVSFTTSQKYTRPEAVEIFRWAFHHVGQTYSKLGPKTEPACMNQVPLWWFLQLTNPPIVEWAMRKSAWMGVLKSVSYTGCGW